MIRLDTRQIFKKDGILPPVDTELLESYDCLHPFLEEMETKYNVVVIQTGENLYRILDAL